MKKLFKIFAVVALTSALICTSGCRGKNHNNEPEDETLLGTDANKDGIRDDIYKKMRSEFVGIPEDEMKVLDQNAHVFQEILELNLDNRNDVLLARSHLDDAFNCGITVYGEELNYDNFSVMLTRLRQWYFNNPLRKRQHQEFMLRSKEYHFEPMNLEGNNTCEFELSEETLKRIEFRKKAKEYREQQKKAEQKN